MSLFCFFFKQKTAYVVRISDWSSDGCSSDLLVGGKVEGSAASWLHDHRMLLWLPVRRRAVDQFEEMAVQMDRVRHHRIVDEFHTDTFVIGEANGVVANGSKLLAVERPHVALHVAGQVDFHLP